MFKVGKEDEFEEKLEFIKRRIEEKRRAEDKLKDLESRIKQVEERVSKVEIPKEILREFEDLRKDVKEFENRVFSEMDKTQKELASLKNEIGAKLIERVKDNLLFFVEEKLKEREIEVKNRIEQIERKMLEIENRINKLVEVLEAIG